MLEANFTSTMGTPTESVWPGVTQYRDFRTNFPVWKAQNLGRVTSDPLLLNLLSVCILVRFS